MPKKIDDSINGLTGEALLEKVYEIIEQHKDEYSKCKAILIEDDLEKYGFFDGKYIKISDQIIEAIQTDVKEEIKQSPKVNQNYVDQIVHSRRLHYSKKLHGQRMLKNIRPDKVADKCKHYFNPAYQKLKEF